MIKNRSNGGSYKVYLVLKEDDFSTNSDPQVIKIENCRISKEKVSNCESSSFAEFSNLVGFSLA